MAATDSPSDIRIFETAEEVARLPLITHMELHIEQLEKLLGSR